MVAQPEQAERPLRALRRAAEAQSRGEGAELGEPLDAVGGTMLLVFADAHRDGLNFPAYPFGRANPLVRAGVGGGEMETEGSA